MSQDSILVTGGAGYVGSHVVLSLIEAGHRVTILDDFSTGHRSSVCGEAEIIEGNFGDQDLVADILRTRQVGSVIHLAAFTSVSESVSSPLRYFHNNVACSLALIDACVRAGIDRFIFSSSASVYGQTDGSPVGEDTPLRPASPYGVSKQMVERILVDVGAATGLRHVALRFFNAAGADPAGRTGQMCRNPTHLIRIACELALGKRDSMFVYGTDYPTPDGTGVRDYIHVSDLADIHVQAMDYLQAGGGSVTLNCGLGKGITVREVIRAVERQVGHPLAYVEAAPRAGDPAMVVADSGHLKRLFNWMPRHSDLETIIATTLAWERSRV